MEKFKYAKRKILDKNAQDIIEFSLVLPILMFVFMFIFTGGQMIFNKQVVFNMAYQGCRAAVVCKSQTEGQRAAEERAAELVPQFIAIKDPNSWKIEVSSDGSWRNITKYFIGGGSTNYCKTTATVTMSTLFPIKNVMSNTLDISAMTKMAIEYNPEIKYDRFGSKYDLN